jgi:hypothetical protein
MYTKSYPGDWQNDNTTPIAASALNNIESGIVNDYTWITKATGDADDLTVANRQVFVDTTSGVYTLTLPASPTVGDKCKFVDVAGQFATNVFTVAVAAGDKLMGVTDDTLDLVANHDFATLTYSGATYGWVITEKP